MSQDYSSLRAGMTAKRSEPVAGILAFAFGLVLVGGIVGLIWAVFETPEPKGHPVIADSAVTAPPLRESASLAPTPEPNSELAGGTVEAQVDLPRPTLPSSEMRDAHLRLYVDTLEQLENCARDSGEVNLRDLRNVYIRANRDAYEAWMDARVADLPLIRRSALSGADVDEAALALQLQERGEGLPANYVRGRLSVNECAQLKVDVQTGGRDVSMPPSIQG